MLILHDNGQGGIAITIPAPNYVQAVIRGYGTKAKVGPVMSELEAVTLIAEKDCPKGCNYEIVKASDIPTDRTFRDAWEHDTTAAPEKVRCNMVKAKVIAHEMRRAEREELMEPLDKQSFYDKSGADKLKTPIRKANAVKQIAIDAAKTETELKAAIL